MTQQRTAIDVLISLAQLQEETLAEIRHIRAVLASGASRSSVEVKTGTNGRPFDIACKAYEGSDILDAEAAAVQSFLRVRAELEERLMAGWESTVAHAKGGK